MAKAGRRANGEGSILERKDGTWMAAVSMGYDAKGKPVRRYLYGKTQKEVRDKMKLLLRSMDDGTAVDPSRMILSAFLERWLLETLPRLKPGTQVKYRQLVNYHLTPRLGHHSLQKLTPIQIQTAMRETGEERGVPTALACFTCLKSALKQGVRWGMLSRNPADAVDPPQPKKRKIAVWEPGQVRHFLEVARAHRFYPLFYLALTTGLRRGELLGLSWKDFENSSLTVRQNLTVVDNKATLSTPKTEAAERRVPLPPDTLLLIAQHRQSQDLERDVMAGEWTESGLVFPSEVGTPMHPRNLERVWYMLLKKSELPRIRMHDLRHTYASMAIGKGVDPKVLADRLGHARASFTLDTYAHVFEAQRESASYSLEDLLNEAKKE